MYYKAVVFGDHAAAREIMRCRDPKAMKRIGSRVRGFNQRQWYPISIQVGLHIFLLPYYNPPNTLRLQVMMVASRQKYLQNPRLRAELYSTAGSLLVEAAPFDKRWGSGVGMESEAVRRRSRWPGQNILGRMLTLVRDRMMEEEGIRAPMTPKKARGRGTTSSKPLPTPG